MPIQQLTKPVRATHPQPDQRPAQRTLRLLFVCVENANRSQMAQAFARLHGGQGVEAWSAGSRPSGRINPRAVATMAELGYDLSHHTQTGLDQLPPGPWDAVVTMGCGDACPSVPARRRIDWQIPDPRELEGDQLRQVRDLIRQHVTALIDELRAAA